MKISLDSLKKLIAETVEQEVNNISKNEWTVEKAGKISYNSNLFSLYSHDILRYKLNVPLLISSKAIYITHGHDSPLKDDPDFQNPEGLKQINAQNKEGWIILPEEKWLFSVVTHWNVLQGGWAKDASKYLKPSSYEEADDYINDKTKTYDGKYLQILWSAAKRGLTSTEVFS